MGEFVCVDLTAFRPAALRDGGAIEPIWPSFCLPWFPGEEPLVGEAARIHRRSSDPNAWESDARLDMGRRGRFHFAEGWLAMLREPDSFQPANVRFEWSPAGKSERRVGVTFPDLVRAVLRTWASRDTALALIVPDGLGPGPRQEVLDRLASEFRKVQFVPRSVAAAMTWLTSPAAQGAVKLFRGAAGQRMGSVLVTTTAADAWEAAVVPIRFEGLDSMPPACPVHERVRHRSEIGIAGLERCVPHSLADHPAAACDIWASWLACDGTRFSFAEHGPTSSSISNAFARWSLPASLDAKWQPSSAKNEVAELLRSLLQHSRILGWIHVDSAGRGVMPESFKFLGGIRLPTTQFVPETSMLKSGLDVLRLIDNRRTPYYESLARVDLFVLGRNGYHDPQEEWLPLIESAEVPVGQTYETRSEILGLSLPPGERAEVTFYVKAERRGGVSHGSFDARQDKPQMESVPVGIRAKLEPGQGLATFQVRSVTSVQFHAEVRESDLQLGVKPGPIHYSWPPGSARVVSDPDRARQARDSLQNLADSLEREINLAYALGAALKFIGKWHADAAAAGSAAESLFKSLDTIFVYSGVVPSEDIDAHSSVEPILQEIRERLPRALRVHQNDELGSTILSVASWLYARCPEGVLAHVRKGLEGNEAIAESVLSCAGNCFTRIQDLRLFYNGLDRRISSGSLGGYAWIRAWRNLCRFQVDAMSPEVLNDGLMQRLFLEYLKAFRDAPRVEKGKAVFLHCCYLAPHVLKRRRFAPDFAARGSEEAERFAAELRRASRTATDKRLENLRCAEKFLNSTADRKTLEDLRRSETA